MKIKNNKWSIIKYFNRLLDPKISVFERMILINPLWILKKMYTFQKTKNPYILSENNLNYIKHMVSDDLILTNKNKKEIILFLESLSGIKSNNWDYEKLNYLIKKIDVKSKNIYYKNIEEKLKDKMNDFINYNEITRMSFSDIKKIISLYISTRIDLGYSIKLMKNYINRERKYLTQSDERKIEFMRNFFEKFKYKNIYKKERYDVFIPLKIESLYFKQMINIQITQDIKIVRYSYFEDKMINCRHHLTKFFEKDNLYLAIENNYGIDGDTLANNVIWEKAHTYLAVFKSFSINIDFNNSKPVAILKFPGKNRKAKIDPWYFSNEESQETDTLFPIVSSKSLLKLMSSGQIKEKTSKFKSFLRSKSAFEFSINPIERINLSARSLELFLKFPYKSGYGGLTKFNAIDKLCYSATANLIYAHTIWIMLLNYSSLKNLDSVKTISNTMYSSSKSKIIKRSLKSICEISNDSKELLDLNPWTQNVIKEIQSSKKLPSKIKNKFTNFLQISSKFITLERNRQIHNKSNYNLKDILLAETVDAILSTSTKMYSFQLLKNNDNKENKISKYSKEKL